MLARTAAQMWLIGGRTPALAPYRRMWEDAIESMIATLVRLPRQQGGLNDSVRII
jgi:hypothetical protein